MIKLKELTENKREEYFTLKGWDSPWKDSKIGIVVKTKGARSISADYQLGDIVIYQKTFINQEKICIGREIKGELARIHAEVPKSYVEEIIEE